MRVVHHRLVQTDLKSALEFYESEGGVKLGDRFFAEVEATIKSVILNPQSFHFANSKYRRADLKKFPYRFLFEADATMIRSVVLRHDKRHPQFGSGRK